MGLFSQRAAAFCWNTNGECFGVLMARDGSKYKVIQHWTDKSAGKDAVSTVLLKGYNELKVSENDFVVAGEMGLRCSFVDVEQPKMHTKDMKKSLNFTLSGHFPLDPVDLSWAYRIVRENEETGLSLVRLMAMKSKIWDDWIDNIGNIKLDTIVSPAAVADAVVEKPVYIPVNEEKGFLIGVNEEGRLQSEPIGAESVDEEAFGFGDDPLASEHLDASQIDPALRQKFTEAVLLGMYALTDSLKSDRETSFEIPKDLSPNRHAMTRSICGACLIILFLLGVFQLSRTIAFKKKEAAVIDSKIDYFKDEMARNIVDSEKHEDMKLLKEEIDTKVETWASARDVLSVVTKALPKNFYLSSFSFRNNKVSCNVEEVTENPKSESTLFRVFKEVDFFDGNIEVTLGSRYISLSMTVRQPVKPKPAAGKGETP